MKKSLQITVLNGEQYIAEALRTVLLCRDDADEILVFNDGSTDSTASIVKEFASADSRIELIDSPDNIGEAAARNYMINHTTADYIIIFDADDWLVPGVVNDQVELLEQYPTIAGSYGKLRHLDVSGNDLGQVQGMPFSHFNIMYENPACHPGMILRKDAVISVGGYLEPHHDRKQAIGTDLWLWMRLAELYDMHFDNRFRVLYRRHQSQLSSESSTREPEACKLFMKKDIITRHQALFDALVAGASISIKQEQKRIIVMLLGIISQMLPEKSQQLLAVLNTAERLAPDDYGVLVHKIRFFIKNEQYQAAEDAIGKMEIQFKDDAFIQALACQYKLDLLSQSVSANKLEEITHMQQYYQQQYMNKGCDTEWINSVLHIT